MTCDVCGSAKGHYSSCSVFRRMETPTDPAASRSRTERIRDGQAATEEMRKEVWAAAYAAEEAPAVAASSSGQAELDGYEGCRSCSVATWCQRFKLCLAETDGRTFTLSAPCGACAELKEECDQYWADLCEIDAGRGLIAKALYDEAMKRAGAAESANTMLSAACVEKDRMILVNQRAAILHETAWQRLRDELRGKNEEIGRLRDALQVQALAASLSIDAAKG